MASYVLLSHWVHFSKEAFWERNMAKKNPSPQKNRLCKRVFNVGQFTVHPVLLAFLEPDLDPFGERLSPGFHSLNTV